MIPATTAPPMVPKAIISFNGIELVQRGKMLRIEKNNFKLTKGQILTSKKCHYVWALWLMVIVYVRLDSPTIVKYLKPYY